MINLVVFIWLSIGLCCGLTAYNETVKEERDWNCILGVIIFTFTWPLLVIGTIGYKQLKMNFKK